ncbi:MAG TPA: hypothetical protein VGK49_08925, partial [Ilumatobacteraceae bacterium]
DGVTGEVTVAGPGQDTVWTVSGEGSGSVAGVDFTNVTTLRGAAGNEDTFVVSQSGSIARVHGGNGGFDSLVVNGSYGSAVFTAFGPNDGLVTLDGRTIAYAGLEPIVASGSLADVVFDLGGLDDEATLSQDGGTLTLSSAGTFEFTPFSVPSSSVTINGGGGRDRVIISGAIALGTASLTIDAELIDVPAGSSIATSGDVTLAAAAHNDVANAASQVARVSVGGTITADGGVVLTATVGQTVALFGQTLSSDTNYTFGSESRAEIGNGAVVSGATLLVRAATTVSFVYQGDAPPHTVFDVSGLPAGGSVNVSINNTTHAGISGGARAAVGNGPLSGTDAASVAIEAVDSTSVSIVITDTSTPSTAVALVEQIGNFLTFDRLAATTTISRDTRAYVEDAPSGADTVATGGAVRVRAENTGTIASEITSDFIGAGHNDVTRDDAVAVLDGAVLDVGGLALGARTATTYAATAKDVVNDVSGATTVMVSDSVVGAGAGGVVLDARDDSALIALSENLVQIPGTPFVTITAARAQNLLDRSTAASANGAEITSAGDVDVLAVGNA